MISDWDNEAGWPGGFSPACVRNTLPIIEVLASTLAGNESALEVGSCTGQHAVAFADALPGLSWQPSDQAGYMATLRANLEHHRLPNIQSPLELDVTSDWPSCTYDLVFTANTFHIMSVQQVEAFFAGLEGVLHERSWLFVYGPFNYSGAYSSDSNAAFDQSLRLRDPLSGIRDFEYIAELAAARDLQLIDDVAMPANNRMLLWRQTNG